MRNFADKASNMMRLYLKLDEPANTEAAEHGQVCQGRSQDKEGYRAEYFNSRRLGLKEVDHELS